MYQTAMVISNNGVLTLRCIVHLNGEIMEQVVSFRHLDADVQGGGPST